MTKILLVDDDRDLVDLLTFFLARAGLAVVSTHEPTAALKLLEAEKPDIAVLDVDMGRWNGFDLLRDLRKTSDIPTIMLTGMGTEKDKLKGFSLGVDDYVTKPFSHQEVLSRIKALLKRRGQTMVTPPPATVLTVGPLELNVTEHTVTRAGRPLNLTVSEFRVLHYLMSRPSAVVPTREIMKHVWGHDDPSGTEAVRVAVHRLRRKLEEGPAQPRLLHTVPGVGIMIKLEPSRAG